MKQARLLAGRHSLSPTRGLFKRFVIENHTEPLEQVINIRYLFGFSMEICGTNRPADQRTTKGMILAGLNANEQLRLAMLGCCNGRPRGPVERVKVGNWPSGIWHAALTLGAVVRVSLAIR
jgi:hypothetical protein